MEVIIAITILTLVFVALVQSFPLGISINTSAKQNTIASYLAQSKIEELYSSGYDNIATGTIETKQRISSNSSDGFYDFWRKTEVSYVDEDLNETSDNTGLKKIDTFVYYFDKIINKEKEVKMSTLISEH